MSSEANRWRLRAEEYRTVRATLTGASARDALRRMISTCEAMARQADRLGKGRHLDANDYAAMAEECEHAALRFANHAVRQTMLDVADRWRKMAGSLQEASPRLNQG